MTSVALSVTIVQALSNPCRDNLSIITDATGLPGGSVSLCHAGTALCSLDEVIRVLIDEEVQTRELSRFYVHYAAGTDWLGQTQPPLLSFGQTRHLQNFWKLLCGYMRSIMLSPLWAQQCGKCVNAN
jgi:hypothetical protein